MRGLTDLERRTLQPVGNPGEWAPDAVFVELVRLGRGRWVPDAEGSYFAPTELGLLALRVCPQEPI